MKTLITGATGYLGSNLVRACLADGHQVSILKRSTSDCSRIADLLHLVKAYDVDTCSLQQPFQDQQVFDAVIHTATCYGRQGESETAILESNLVFPLQLLELSIAYSTRTFINTDTGLDKTLNAYALSKNQFVEWGRQLSGQEKIRFINLVVEHFYGPNDDSTKFVSYIIDSCLKNIPEIALTAGEQFRDFLFIDDVVHVYQLLLSTGNDIDDYFQEYEVGSGQPVAIRDLVQMIHRLTGSRSELKFGAVPYRQNEAMHSCADITALKKLGWKPSTDLNSGLEKTINGEEII